MAPVRGVSRVVQAKCWTFGLVTIGMWGQEESASIMYNSLHWGQCSSVSYRQVASRDRIT